MYPPGHFEPHLNTAAGPSSYITRSSRRPWSPVHYDEDVTDSRWCHDYFAEDNVPGSVLRQDRQRREASEGSVEALDLADYARTLRGSGINHNIPYPPFPHTSYIHPLSVPTPVRANPRRASLPPRSLSPYPELPGSYPEYPPSPIYERPFSVQSRDTFSQAPPSLVSGDTHDSHESSSSQYPSQRIRSLPSFFASVSKDHVPNRGPAIFSATSSSRDSLARLPSPILDEKEVDISRFPPFSRGWYNDSFKAAKSKHSSLPPHSFELHYGAYNPYPSTASSQSRDILPWSSQLSDVNGSPVDDSIKEERIRMLEREFGGKVETARETEKALIGSVDQKGALITPGPKKRAAARWAQGVLALVAAASSLYGALFIKTSTPAPPASKLPAFALYIFSVITLLLTFYLFAIRPCCCGKRRKSGDSVDPMAGGLMVLPIQGPQKKKKKKKGKKEKYGNGGDVQVNLIVDPSMFGSSGRHRDEEYGSEDGYDDVDGSQVSLGRRGGRNKAQQRRSIFQGLQMESDWTHARTFLKRLLFLDILCLIIWAGVFVLILFGKKCSPGGFSGWCDSYNIASAAACVLCLAFGFSVFFDIIDLHKSKASPRTRT